MYCKGMFLSHSQHIMQDVGRMARVCKTSLHLCWSCNTSGEQKDVMVQKHLKKSDISLPLDVSTQYKDFIICTTA